MRRLIRALIRPGDDGLFSQVMSAGFWAAALRILLRILLIARTVVLARLLAPDDFGVMAVATLSMLFLERVSRSGISQALIQRRGDIGPYLNTAWTLQIVRGLAMAGILVLAAPWISEFFRIPETLQVLRVVSISVALKGFVNIAVVTFAKDLRFDKLFIYQMGSRGTDIVASIVAAFVLRSVWALVIGVLVNAVMQVILSYVISEFRPRLEWVWEYVKQLLNFGKWIFVSQILGFASGNLDDIVVGRMLGAESLGFYRMAYNFSQSIATEVTAVTYQVAFPTYSKLQAAAGKLHDAYLGTVHLVAFIGFPIAIGIILVAPDLTFGLLGDKWAPIVVPMQIMSIAGLIRGIAGTAGPLFQSQGRPQVTTYFQIAFLAVMTPLLYPMVSRFGIVGAAATLAFTGLMTGIPHTWLALAYVHAKWRDIKQSLVFPALNTAFMAGGVIAMRLAFFPEPTVLSLVMLTATGAASYLIAVYLSTKLLGYASPTDLLKRVRQAAS
jgi:lipopolysaccharide exporter